MRALRAGLALSRDVFLSTATPTPRERELAVVVALLCLLAFAVAAPFASVKLPEIPAFIAVYQSVLITTDVITAVLLFGQFALLRTLALLVLACGYLFAALTAAVHALSFPGLFTPTGLLGANSQSTAWLYMFWHGGFPIAVIAYTVLRRSDRRYGESLGAARRAIGWGVLAVLSLVDILVFFGVLLVGFAYVWKRGDLDWVRAISRKNVTPAEILSAPPSPAGRRTPQTVG